jgi:hypothetical protein
LDSIVARALLIGDFIDSIGHSLTLQRGIDMIRDVAEADTASSPTRPLGAARNPGERLGSY